VRRVYRGQRVLCKQCQHPFFVSAPGELLADPPGAGSGTTPARGDDRIDAMPDRLGTGEPSAASPPVDDRLAAEYQRLKRMHEQLQAAHQQLEVEHQQLEVEHGRLLSESRQLQSEDHRLRAEVDRLRAEVEAFRRLIEQARRTDRDELARLETELTRLLESKRQLQERYALTEQLCQEYHDRNQALLWDLARLKSETASRIRSGQPAPAPWVAEPRALPAASGPWSVVSGQ
jgi:hypothetical protein